MLTRSSELALSVMSLFRGFISNEDTIKDTELLCDVLFNRRSLAFVAVDLDQRMSTEEWDFSFLMSDHASAVLWKRMLNALKWYSDVSSTLFCQFQNLVAQEVLDSKDNLYQRWVALEDALMLILSKPLKHVARDIITGLPDAIDMMPNCVAEAWDELLFDPDYGLTLGTYGVKLSEMQAWERRDDLLVAAQLSSRIKKTKFGSARDVELLLGCISENVDRASTNRRNRSEDLMCKSNQYYTGETPEE